MSSVAIALIAIPATRPTAAANTQLDSSQVTAVHSDVSAQKKQKKKKVTSRHYRSYGPVYGYGDDPTRSPYYLRPGVAPSFGYIGPPGYAGEYAWRRSIGQCVEDLGYGRWAACGSR